MILLSVLINFVITLLAKHVSFPMKTNIKTKNLHMIPHIRLHTSLSFGMLIDYNEIFLSFILLNYRKLYIMFYAFLYLNRLNWNAINCF